MSLSFDGQVTTERGWKILRSRRTQNEEGSGCNSPRVGRGCCEAKSPGKSLVPVVCENPVDFWRIYRKVIPPIIKIDDGIIHLGNPARTDALMGRGYSKVC